MEKPKNWDNVVANTGDFESLKLGGHEVVIKDAYEYTGQSGTTSLRVEVDIAGNDEQKGFYQKQFDNNPSENKKWSPASTKYISLKQDDTCVAMFKGFTTCVEKSNEGYVWNFDEKTLIGKKLCGVYGLEEYQDENGNLRTATKLVQFRSLDKLDEIKIPKVRKLDGSLVDYETYKNVKADPLADFGNTVEVEETAPFEI